MAVDTFFVGTLNGVGNVYLQTAIDCHSRHAWARRYTSKLPVTAAHLVNQDVTPAFETAGARIKGRRTCFKTFDEMQVVLDDYMVVHSRKRPRQGHGMNGRTAWQAFQDGLPAPDKSTKIKQEEEPKAAWGA